MKYNLQYILSENKNILKKIVTCKFYSTNIFINKSSWKYGHFFLAYRGSTILLYFKLCDCNGTFVGIF